jgi:hypothetical protein
MAYILDKFIIPLAIDKNPYGFIGKYQALKFNPEKIFSECREIIKIIANNEKFYDNLVNLLINSLANSSSFDDAGNKAFLLSCIEIRNKEQISKIINAIMSNGQVRFSFKAHSWLSDIFNKHQILIDKNLFEKMNKQMIDNEFKLN